MNLRPFLGTQALLWQVTFQHPSFGSLAASGGGTMTGLQAPASLRVSGPPLLGLHLPWSLDPQAIMYGLGQVMCARLLLARPSCSQDCTKYRLGRSAQVALKVHGRGRTLPSCLLRLGLMSWTQWLDAPFLTTCPMFSSYQDFQPPPPPSGYGCPPVPASLAWGVGRLARTEVLLR